MGLDGLLVANKEVMSRTLLTVLVMLLAGTQTAAAALCLLEMATPVPAGAMAHYNAPMLLRTAATLTSTAAAPPLNVMLTVAFCQTLHYGLLDDTVCGAKPAVAAAVVAADTATCAAEPGPSTALFPTWATLNARADALYVTHTATDAVLNVTVLCDATATSDFTFANGTYSGTPANKNFDVVFVSKGVCTVATPAPATPAPGPGVAPKKKGIELWLIAVIAGVGVLLVVGIVCFMRRSAQAAEDGDGAYEQVGRV
jgi:hypothetical protein